MALAIGPVNQATPAGVNPERGCCQGLRNLIGSIVDTVTRVFSAIVSFILCRRREPALAVPVPTTNPVITTVVTDALPPSAPVPPVPVNAALPSAPAQNTIPLPPPCATRPLQAPNTLAQQLALSAPAERGPSFVSVERDSTIGSRLGDLAKAAAARGAELREQKAEGNTKATGGISAKRAEAKKNLAAASHARVAAGKEANKFHLNHPKYASLVAGYAAIPLFDAFAENHRVLLGDIPDILNRAESDEVLKTKIDTVSGSMPFSSENKVELTFCSVLWEVFKQRSCPIKIYQIHDPEEPAPMNASKLRPNEDGSYLGSLEDVIVGFSDYAGSLNDCMGGILVGEPSVQVLIFSPAGRCGILKITDAVDGRWVEKRNKDELLASLDERTKAERYRILPLGCKPKTSLSN